MSRGTATRCWPTTPPGAAWPARTRRSVTARWPTSSAGTPARTSSTPAGAAPSRTRGSRYPPSRRPSPSSLTLASTSTSSPAAPRTPPPCSGSSAAPGPAHRVRLASFHSLVIRQVREDGYPGGTSFGSSECAWLALAPASLLRPVSPGTAAQIPTRLGPVAADTPAFLERCHRLGLQVHFWTINEPDEARRLLALGADGIMTDDPRRVGPVVLSWTS
jgi:hypothetical protein